MNDRYTWRATRFAPAGVVPPASGSPAPAPQDDAELGSSVCSKGP